MNNLNVCPTYVGMNRRCALSSARSRRMPHVCGDEPCRDVFPDIHFRYAPRMWG